MGTQGDGTGTVDGDASCSNDINMAGPSSSNHNGMSDLHNILCNDNSQSNQNVMEVM
jgi:hypothetical protein